MGALRLPERLRGELSKTYGILFTNTPVCNVKAILRVVNSKRPPKVTVVGDFTLKAFLDAGFRPDLGIFDNKTRRASFRLLEKPTAYVANPAGTITDESVSIIKRALESDSPCLLFVEGEEDLLSLPAIIHSPVGSLVVYGMPNKGMIAISVQKEIKEKICGLLSQFERVC